MTVYFIGAGPGAADLITVRGQRLLESCPVCLYAGSIMPEDLLALCPADARVVDTGPLTLDQIVEELAAADAAGHDVARLHSGDPSLYSAVAEQCRRLDAQGIDYEIVPGVPAFAAAAAVLRRELTVPGVAQTVTLSRVATLSTAMPPGEDLTTLSTPGATLVLHLAAAQIDTVVPQLLDGGYRPETPCAVVAFVSWPQQQVLHGTLGRHRGPDARRGHHPHRGDRGRRRPHRRRVRRQLSVFAGAPAHRAALMRVLLLGGTAEARVLAERLHPDIDVISSLAGRVPNPALPAGEVRIGGFGGAEPMRQWLVDSRVDAVVDATHPFAAVMTERTARVCGELGLPHLVLARPPWDSSDSIAVGSAAEAAEVVEHQGYSRVFLTSGRSTIGSFAHSNAWFLIRVVIAPARRRAADASHPAAVPRAVHL